MAASPPGRRSRSSAASERSRRWNSSLPIGSMRSRSASPPSRVKSSRRRTPVLDRLDVPARGVEHPHQAPGGDVGHDAVERLAVEVDDPQHLAQARDHRVGDRLPDRALVELGVAEQRDVAPAARHLEVPGHVAVGHRAPDRGRRADADRAGRVVDGVGVLAARRIGLQPAVLAQPRQVGGIEPAEQEVDRVQDGRGVRLDRDAVGRLEVLEPQRRHQRDHRRARRLMAADLDAARVRADAVGVMDDRRRQPQHASLDPAEQLDVDVLAELPVGDAHTAVSTTILPPSPEAWRCHAEAMSSSGTRSTGSVSSPEAACRSSVAWASRRMSAGTAKVW